MPDDALTLLQSQVRNLRDDLDALQFSFIQKTGPDSQSLQTRDITVGNGVNEYQITDGGIYTFGDGSDGAAVFDGVVSVGGFTLAGSTYTQTRDVYLTDASVSTGITIKPSGYRIFGTGTLNLIGTALIHRNGNAGADAVGVTGGAGGAALADGYLKGSLAGVAGGNTGGPPIAGSNGNNTANSIGSNGVAGGAGGNSDNQSGAAGGSAGTATASNVKLIANSHLATLIDIGSTGAGVKFDNSASSGGGGGGASGSGGSGGSGGGSGTSGGIVAIYFRNIIISSAASLTANGGKGGNGSNGAATAGGGGGGGGGNGGQIILVYNSLVNDGTLTASGGAGGTQGTGGNASGIVGATGNAGNLRQFKISL